MGLFTLLSRNVEGQIDPVIGRLGGPPLGGPPTIPVISKQNIKPPPFQGSRLVGSPITISKKKINSDLLKFGFPTSSQSSMFQSTAPRPSLGMLPSIPSIPSVSNLPSFTTPSYRPLPSLPMQLPMQLPIQLPQSPMQFPMQLPIQLP